MIDLLHLTKRFESRGAQPVVDDVSMTVAEGELCVLLGPSGCGKTTTLKMINRLVQPSAGQILIGGEDTARFDVVELRRRIGYAIQQVGLFPNMTVEQNIGLVPGMLGWDKVRIRRRVEALLEMVTLDPAIYMRCFPRDLSGGQQQRVGVARALAADPPVMLMDEPFGAIDPINRASIQDEFRKIQQSLRKTVMFVSHDIDEAMKMADKVAIFRNGKLEQLASPDDLLARPANDFIADFVGADRALRRLRLQLAADTVIAPAMVVRIGQSFSEARLMLRQQPVDALVVLDAQEKLVGWLDRAQVEQAAGAIEVSALLPLAATLRTGDDLRVAMSIMLSHGVDWLPTVDEAGRFVGYLTVESIAARARAACSAGEALAAGSARGNRHPSASDNGTNGLGASASRPVRAGGGMR